jgi:hypothetical protein
VTIPAGIHQRRRSPLRAPPPNVPTCVTTAA